MFFETSAQQVYNGLMKQGISYTKYKEDPYFYIVSSGVLDIQKQMFGYDDFEIKQVREAIHEIVVDLFERA